LMKIFYLLFLLVLQTACSDAQDTDLCKCFFDSLTDSSYQGPDVSAQVSHYHEYSGHNLNDLGDYNTCISTASQTYSLMTLAGPGGRYNVGVCGPSYCTLAQLQAGSATLVSFLSKTGQDLSKFSATLSDPSALKPEGGFWLYFTIFILMVLCLLVAAGTISANSKQESCKRMKNSDGLSTSLMVNEDQDESETKVEKSLMRKIIECFDVVQNFKDLVKKDEKNPNHDQNLSILNGVRTFAFFTVVYGHSFMYSMSTPRNYTYLPLFMQSGWILTIFGALYAVDTFFYLGGFLTGFLMLSKLKRMPVTFKSYMQILFHRWIRLWPAYFIAIMFYWKIAVHMGSGPIWSNLIRNAEFCATSAWQNLIFMDNVLAKNYACFSWGWYLSCDFQAFLLLPFVCWVYLGNKTRGNLTILGLIIVSSVTSYLYCLKTGVSFFPLAILKGTDPTEFMSNFYPNPVVRMSTTMFGLWLGIMFKEYKAGEKNIFNKLQESSRLSLLSLVLGIIVLVFVIFFPGTLIIGMWSDIFAMTWNTFGRLLWAVGIFLVTAPCLVGNLKFVRSILGSFIFNLVTRVSYGGYLVHLALLFMILYGSNEYYNLSPAIQISLALLVFVVSCIIAVALHLLVEKPITNIETKVLNAKKPSRKPVENKAPLNLSLKNF